MKSNLFTDPKKVISIGRTEHCVRISYSGVTVQFRFLITMSELNEAASRTDLSQAWSDCGSILHAHYYSLMFYDSACGMTGEHKTKTVTFRMNCAKFFKRIKQLVDDGVVTESKSVELCTDSFMRGDVSFRQLKWADILRDVKFQAVSSLKELMAIADGKALRSLENMLSIKLQQGFTIYPDGGPNFYFEVRSGNAVSNGGIIYDRRTETYSIHT